MKKKNQRKFLVKTVVLVTAIGVLGAVAANIDNWKERSLGIMSFFADSKPAKVADYDPDRWYLVLVNDDNSVPQEYLEGLTLTELSNGERVDTRVYPYLQQMFDDARAQGIHPYVREGYRSGEDQQAIMNERVQRYLDEGHSKRRAQKMAEEYVAEPGTSEHELGIAVDINADTNHNTNDEVYLWLRKNAHKYGFILRYDLGKEELTGTSYEPWHFRYVGADAAAEMYQLDLCLEEYLNRA